MGRQIAGWAVVLLAMAGLACPEQDPTIRFGAIVSLGDDPGGAGQSIKNAIELAVEAVQAEGGIEIDGERQPLALILRDAKGSAEIATRIAREFIDSDIQAVVGPYLSHVTLGVAPLFQEAGVVLLSPAASTPKLTRAGDYIFRNFPSDELEAINSADYVYNKAGVREILVIGNQSEFGLGVKNAFIGRFRILGGRVIEQVTYEPDAADFAGVVSRIEGGNQTAIYIAGYSADTAALAVALRAAEIEAPLFGTGAVLPQTVVELGGEAVEGLVFPQPYYEPESDQEFVRTFVTRYRQRYGQEPDLYAAHAYDAVFILTQAIQERGRSASQIRFYLNSMNPFEGAGGTTKVQRRRRCTKVSPNVPDRWRPSGCAGLIAVSDDARMGLKR